MERANQKHRTLAAKTAFSEAPGETQPIAGAVARIFLRRDASHHALQQMQGFLETSVTGDYATGQAGSPRMGYWYVIDVTDRRDLDQIRAKAPHLIDGWMEFN